MVDCPFFNHCEDDCRQCTEEMKQQKTKEIAMELVPVVTEAFNALVSVVADGVKAVIDFTIAMYKQYPNKRVVWLALCHPKARVRKKNKSRIIKYFKEVENEDTDISYANER